MSSIVEINPLIRHAQLLTVADSKLYGSAIAYDNRIFLCVDGSGDIVISDIAYPMHSGTLLMWKSGMPYRYAPSSHAPLKMIGFNFDFTKQSENKTMAIPPSKVEVFDSSLMTEQIYFSDVTSFNSPLYLTDMFSLRENFLEIKNEFDNKKRFFMQRCSALFFNILIITCAFF